MTPTSKTELMDMGSILPVRHLVVLRGRRGGISRWPGRVCRRVRAAHPATQPVPRPPARLLLGFGGWRRRAGDELALHRVLLHVRLEGCLDDAGRGQRQEG